LNPSTKQLEIVTTANQDPLLTHIPIIGVDIWEHAFYLQYLNVKVDVRIQIFDYYYFPRPTVLRSLARTPAAVSQCYLARYQLPGGRETLRRWLRGIEALNFPSSRTNADNERKKSGKKTVFEIFKLLYQNHMCITTL
jgi:hypothetical protein